MEEIAINLEKYYSAGSFEVEVEIEVGCGLRVAGRATGEIAGAFSDADQKTMFDLS